MLSLSVGTNSFQIALSARNSSLGWLKRSCGLVDTNPGHGPASLSSHAIQVKRRLQGISSKRRTRNTLCQT